MPFVTRHTHEIRKLVLQQAKDWNLAMGFGNEPHPFDLALAESQQKPIQHSTPVESDPIVIETQVDVSAKTLSDLPDSDESEKTMREAKGPSDERRAEVPKGIENVGEPTIEAAEPLANQAPPSPTTWTNLLLSRAIEAWKIGVL